MRPHEIECYVRNQLSKGYRVPFAKRKVFLYSTNESREFDAVSADQKVIANIKSITCKDTKRNYSLLNRLWNQILKLSLVKREHPNSEVLLVLTDPTAFQIWKESPNAIKANELGIQIKFIPIPDW